MSRRLNTMLSRRWAGGGEDNTDYTLLPLTFKCLTGGVLSIKNEYTTWDRNFEYSLNGGAWTAFSLPQSSGVLTIASLSPGDTISFRRDNDNFYQAQFINDSSLTFDLCGNLLSLQYGSAFNGQTAIRSASKAAFGYTFKGTNVVDASKLVLPSQNLSSSCFKEMFRGCALLVKAPDALLATTLTNACYHSMFYECSSLVSAPEIYATSLANNCCNQMFFRCTSLVKAPSRLHAISIDKEGCYGSMFQYCSSLLKSPVILATSISGSAACRKMFANCTLLNYVKCLLTPDNSKMSDWLLSVSATGTFIKAAGTTWTSGASGIPSGWTVVDDTE